MNIFLEGKSQVGKSTLIRNICKDKEVTGVITQRLIENGKIVGFKIEHIDGEYPSLEVDYKNSDNNIFLFKKEMNIEVLEKNILKLEERLKNRKKGIVILDEIGGIELKSRIFLESIINILQSDNLYIGVFKSRENLIKTLEKRGLGSEYLVYHEELKKIIKKNGEIIELYEENIEKVKKYIEKIISDNEL